MTRSEAYAYGRASETMQRDGQHMNLPDLLDSRRTIRAFSSRPVADDDLATVLWAAQGQTSDGRRTTPSAAGYYPLQLIIVRGRPEGTWTWAPADRSLVPRGRHDVRTALSAAAIGEQPWVLTAPATVVFCADVDGMVEHFADQPPDGRGRRYVDVEIGAAVQNLALSCTARGLGGVIVGGFDDALVADTLDLDTYEPRLLFSLGHPA